VEGKETRRALNTQGSYKERIHMRQIVRGEGIEGLASALRGGNSDGVGEGERRRGAQGGS